MNKIIETTEIISRLTKSSKLTKKSTTTTTTATTTTTTTSSQSKKINKGPNKFKTGGIVATVAVQPIKKSKKIRAHVVHTAPQSIGNNITRKLLDSCTETDSENVKIFVKKVKTKLKKKKSSSKGGLN